MPERNNLVKDFNHIVDAQLKEVVDKINLKSDLEKRNRELQQKAQKRLDEVQNLEMQNHNIADQIDMMKNH